MIFIIFFIDVRNPDLINLFTFLHDAFNCRKTKGSRFCSKPLSAPEKVQEARYAPALYVVL